jgi:hypothetical protein
MKKTRNRGASIGVRAAGALVVIAGLCATAQASSHREAQGITSSPKVDATDFYMFRSYEPGREGFVTLIANYIPFQTPYGGPNFFAMDPDALYQIHIDNDGDAREDITFTFRFSTQLRNRTLGIGGSQVAVPLYNIGRIGPFAFQNSNQTIQEIYSVDVTFGDRYTGQTFRLVDAVTGAESFRKPADFVGEKSFLNYESYAMRHVYRAQLPGSRARARFFVGQRKDPFVANLGEIFDLVNLNPVGAPDARADTLADDNVTSLIIEVPAQWLRTAGDGGTTSRIVGGWTTSSLPQNRTLVAAPAFNAPATVSGPWVQVSRLGMPLVNEVVIGLPDKDKFNNSQPSGDRQFLTYVTNPTLPALLNVLFGVTPPTTPRSDLVSVFLTGVEGLNQPANVVASEMLRLNTDTPVVPKGQQNRLGVVGGDNSGFPNGRRPGDDVVDIALRAVMGAVRPDAGQPGGSAPSGNLAYTDQAIVNDSFFTNQFPYLLTPIGSSPNTTPVP